MKNEQRHLWLLLVTACMVVFCATQPGMGLVVSEIMYHPTDASGTLEFIELYNNRAVIEDLTNYAFTNGIQYVFEPGTAIGPKGYLVVARDPAALEEAYGITGVKGPFSGRLDNDGERIELSNGGGGIVLSLRYGDELPWPLSPDGTGHSLILARPGGDPDEASTWSPSTFIDGTPGGPDEVQVGQEDPTMATLVSIGHPGRYYKGTQEPAPGPDGETPTTAWTEIDFYDNTARTPWADGPSGYGYSNDPSEL
ncbi:MAG: lamin tail domain-containing protein, partial [Planctomycetota bacterium]